MPSFTDRLNLMRHTLADRFRVQDYANNWARLDQHPGVFICTSGTRPTWGARQEGMCIFETDTQLIWHWSGSEWERLVPKGLLGRNSVTTDDDNATTSYTTAVSVTVTVPEGGRTIKVSVEGPGVWSTEGLTELAIFRDATQLQSWLEQGGQGADPIDRPRPLSMTTFDESVTAGSRTYSLQFRATSEFGGTSTLEAGANTPLAIAVEEV